MQDPKNRNLGTIAQLCQAISSQLRYVSIIGKNMLSSNISPTWPYNIVNFDLLAAEIFSLSWGTQANFNGFRVLTALLHGTLVLGISETLRRWTDGATYIWQGSHHVGHWPTFSFIYKSFQRSSSIALWPYHLFIPMLLVVYILSSSFTLSVIRPVGLC